MHSAKYSKMFQRLTHITDELYEVELVKPENEHREPIIDGCFSTTCKTENVGTLLQFPPKVL